jgi:GNAT superfamily N-acetyltransferase
VSVDIRRVSGAALVPFLPGLAELRLRVFREFPYLYDGDLAYERRYLRVYVDAPDSVAVLALEGDRLVGASTGLPLAREHADFQRPFFERGIDPATVFYNAESVLLPDHRGKGLYRSFFEGREAHARALPGVTRVAFCAVERPVDHPRRPVGYAPLDPVWTKFGYVRQPDLTANFPWKDLDEATATDKKMVFWWKDLA